MYVAVQGAAVRIYNRYYQQLYALEPQCGPKGKTIDTHEADITGNDTVLMIVCPEATVDFTSQGSPADVLIWNCSFQEQDSD